jgi:hypothetical protein
MVSQLRFLNDQKRTRKPKKSLGKKLLGGGSRLSLGGSKKSLNLPPLPESSNIEFVQDSSEEPPVKATMALILPNGSKKEGVKIYEKTTASELIAVSCQVRCC